MTTSKADGLLAKHHLLLAIIYSDWASKLDHKVAATIIERYMAAHSNSRCSLRYLERATKATRPNIIASLRRLTDNGAFTIIREGAGTRPTEYRLNFGFARGIVDDTSVSGIAGDTATKSSGIVGDTSSGTAGDTASRPSGSVGDTESHLLNPLTSGVTVNTSAPGTAAGLAAAPARAVDVEVEIVDSEIEEDDGDRWLTLTLMPATGISEKFGICVESADGHAQDRGQARLAKLLNAVGIIAIDDSNELHGHRFMLTMHDDFAPLATHA